MDRPRVRFTTNSDVRVAYQVIGSGPVDLVLVPDGSIPLDSLLEEASCATFLGRLSSFARLITFDRRGTGLSDPVSPSSPPTLEQWAGDAVSVLDAVGSTRAHVLGLAEGGLVVTTLAACWPDRVAGLVLVNATPGGAVPFDDPGAIVALHQDLHGHIDEAWEDDEDLMSSAIAAFAPSAAGDPRYRAWLIRANRHAMSPTMMRAFFAVFYDADIRTMLGSVTAPTLVIHRAENRYVTPAQGRYLADHITGATYVEVPGADHVPYLGDTEPVLSEIESFVAGDSAVPTRPELATVVFTDIVASTERAARLGDRRWRELLDEHDLAVRRLLGRCHGREVKSTGDGVLAVFDSACDAVTCVLAIQEEVGRLGIEIRAGLHHGEVESRGGDIAGLAVNIAARIEGLAEPGVVLASCTVTDVLSGSDISFEDRGDHTLKGVPGTWRLYAVTSSRVVDHGQSSTQQPAAGSTDRGRASSTADQSRPTP